MIGILLIFAPIILVVNLLVRFHLHQQFQAQSHIMSWQVQRFPIRVPFPTAVGRAVKTADFIPAGVGVLAHLAGSYCFVGVIERARLAIQTDFAGRKFHQMD